MSAEPSTIIFASDAVFPDVTSLLAEYLAPHGYRVIPARATAEVLEIIGRESIACVVLTAPLALHPLESGELFIQSLPASLPTVTFGSFRKIGYEWIRVCAGRRNQEWGNMPFDIEELLIKVRKVIDANT